MYGNLFQISFPCCIDPSSSGIAVLFFLQFAMLIIQYFWVCDVTDTGWKQIPGAICLVPQVVPISLVVSGLPYTLPLYFCPFIHPLDSQQRSFRMSP